MNRNISKVAVPPLVEDVNVDDDELVKDRELVVEIKFDDEEDAVEDKDDDDDGGNEEEEEEEDIVEGEDGDDNEEGVIGDEDEEYDVVHGPLVVVARR
jgi:hypothetical protein